MSTIVVADADVIAENNKISVQVLDALQKMLCEVNKLKELSTAPVLFTEKEAAKYIGMSSVFLRKARSEGTVGCRTPAPLYVEIGTSIRYEKNELDRWLADLPRKRARREALQG